MQKYNKLFVPIPGFPGYEINLNGQVWSHRSGRMLAGSISGRGYRQFSMRNVDLKFHCLTLARSLGIAFLGIDANSKLQVDHRDEDKLNDNISNLRIASSRENCHNVSITSRNTSGHRGVAWSKASGNWVVRIMFGGKNLNLGRFNDINEAAAVRKSAEIKYHGKFRPGYDADQPANEEGAL